MIANAIVSNRQACDYLDKQQKNPRICTLSGIK